MQWHKQQGRVPSCEAHIKTLPEAPAGFKWAVNPDFTDEFEGNDGKPGTKYSLAGGAVASKSDQAWYGYYEVRMKASPTPMSSTFWLKNLPNTIRYVDESGKLITEHHRQELDIIETMGKPTRFPNWNRQFNANTHYLVSVAGGSDPPQLAVAGPKDQRATTEPSADDYHTYRSPDVHAHGH